MFAATVVFSVPDMSLYEPYLNSLYYCTTNIDASFTSYIHDVWTLYFIARLTSVSSVPQPHPLSGGPLVPLL